MLRYLETFYRHRILLLAPVVLALAASLGYTMTQPRLYQASAKVWVDSAASVAGDLNSSAYASPADSQASVLREWLQTRWFTDRVGYRGPLATYLTQRPNAYSGPFSNLGGSLFGSSGGESDAQHMDNLLADTVNKRALVLPLGPQILSVTFDAPNPSVAAGTAQALVDEFLGQIRSTRQAQAQAVVDFYKQQVAALPKPSPSDEIARARVAGLEDKLDQAKLQLAALTVPGAGGFRVIDAPLIPEQAKSIRKVLLLAGVAGLVIGLAVSLFVLMLLTWSDRTLRFPEEAETMLGRRVAGAIPLVR
jgi:uncharacterized protein involved in exopolysaccharide biosynthesis